MVEVRGRRSLVSRGVAVSKFKYGKAANRTLTASEDNDYTVTFYVRLGAPPLRGAVRVVPSLSGARSYTMEPAELNIFADDWNTSYPVTVTLDVADDSGLRIV